MAISPQLMRQICRQTSRPVSAGVYALCDKILERHGHRVAAILYYGSCFRRGDDSEGIVDLYLLVDTYHDAYQNRIQAVLNKLLPPNVFYLEMPFEGRVVRAKYAILSLADLERGTSMRCFHSYFWGRFAQPAGLAYARDDQVAQRVCEALAGAVMTFVVRVLPEMTSPFTARELWRTGFVLSYRAELRTEDPDGVGNLFDAEPEHYEQLTRATVGGTSLDVQAFDAAVYYQAGIPERARRLSRLAWGARRLQGKALSILRLFKGLFTFHGGIDYILWKIERHSGVSVEVAPRLRRLPILGVCIVFWRVYRQGGFR
ncbi:MAG: hypothetical protein JRI47_03685 [Deltaproteobacteria bacterium]|nr:hypothetical protein [Deltaproteobacteria bacterium]